MYILLVTGLINVLLNLVFVVILGMSVAGVALATIIAQVISGVGCLLRARLRDASGVTIRQLEEHLEIVSLNGTVSQARCHLHISLSKEDLSTVGGHLCLGCIVNTTCELVILELPDIAYGVEADPETGYDEIVFTRK